MSFILMLLIIMLLFSGGGYYGHRRGYYGARTAYSGVGLGWLLLIGLLFLMPHGGFMMR